MENSNIYEQIARRTKGDIYIGVVGPVRTGKSTFIKSFMETMVLPNIDDVYLKERMLDELPQSSSGKTIMTSEPKFVPEDSVSICVEGDVHVGVRMIDCVGYMVPGALGEFEGDSPRMVSTPWYEHDVPLAQAAETGTQKVITEHSTVGIVITTDGSIGELPREVYIDAETRVVTELKAIKKPFVMLLNTAHPNSPETKALCMELAQKHGVVCLPQNCSELNQDDIELILKSLLYEFPVSEFSFTFPDWLNTLAADHPIRESIYASIWEKTRCIEKMGDAQALIAEISTCEYIESSQIVEMGLSDGVIRARLAPPAHLFYQIIREQTGLNVENDGDLLPLLSHMSTMCTEYERVRGALEQVRNTGYGIVMPTMCEMHLEEPEIVRQGGRFGVRLKASAPSIHLIRADIETEISPIVGSEKQSEELVKYLLSEFEEAPEKIWESNIFGKSLHELVSEGLNNKLYKMPDDARSKIQETLQRIINEGSGGLICIIL